MLQTLRRRDDSPVVLREEEEEEEEEEECDPTHPTHYAEVSRRVGPVLGAARNRQREMIKDVAVTVGCENEERDTEEADDTWSQGNPQPKKPRRGSYPSRAKLSQQEKLAMSVQASSVSAQKRDGDISSRCIDVLPNELIVRIFHFLLVKDLARASLTCSQWHALAHEDQLWRTIFMHARRNHFLECSANSVSTSSRLSNGSGTRMQGLSWKSLFRETYSVKRNKLWFASNEATVVLDRKSFFCRNSDDEEEFLTGEAILHIYNESITTQGLYLVLVGEESFKATDAESLSMNGTEKQHTLFEIYVPLSGNTEWVERKNNKHMFFRGTYHYPFRIPIPRCSSEGADLPPSYERNFKSSGNFFKVSYYAYSVLVMAFPHSNLVSQRQKLRFKPSPKTEHCHRANVINKHSTPHVERMTYNSFNYLFFQKSGNVIFGVELQKRYFFLNAEEIRIAIRVDNSQGRFPIQSITVSVMEELHERGNDSFREIVIRRGSRRVYDEPNAVAVGRGQIRQDIELFYPLSSACAKSASLFNCSLFRHRFSLCVALNIFGCTGPRLEIPIFILRVPV